MIRRGFTFIEMLVVISVIGLALPVLFSLILTILQQQTKIYRLVEVKRQGDYILNIMENNIRNNASSIYSGVPNPNDTNLICDTSGSSGSGSYFKDKLGNWFHYLNLDKVSSQSSTTSQLFDLTNSKVRVSNFSISCNRKSSFSPPIVTVTFNICYNTGVDCSSSRPEETASMTYQTKIKLRNY